MTAAPQTPALISWAAEILLDMQGGPRFSLWPLQIGVEEDPLESRQGRQRWAEIDQWSGSVQGSFLCSFRLLNRLLNSKKEPSRWQCVKQYLKIRALDMERHPQRRVSSVWSKNVVHRWWCHGSMPGHSITAITINFFLPNSTAPHKCTVPQRTCQWY